MTANVRLRVSFCQQREVIECRVGCFNKAHTTQHKCVCVCVCVWTEWLEEQLWLCGSAVTHRHTHTHTHLSLRITSVSMLLLQQQELWIFDVAVSSHQIYSFIFYLFIFHHFPLSFSLIWIPVSRSAVLSEWLKQAKYERHKGWMKFLELETSASLWRKAL